MDRRADIVPLWVCDYQPNQSGCSAYTFNTSFGPVEVWSIPPSFAYGGQSGKYSRNGWYSTGNVQHYVLTLERATRLRFLNEAHAHERFRPEAIGDWRRVFSARPYWHPMDDVPCALPYGARYYEESIVEKKRRAVLEAIEENKPRCKQCGVAQDQRDPMQRFDSNGNWSAGEFCWFTCRDNYYHEWWKREEKKRRDLAWLRRSARALKTVRKHCREAVREASRSQRVA